MSQAGPGEGAATGPSEVGNWHGDRSTSFYEARVSMAGDALVVEFADGTVYNRSLEGARMSSRIRGVPVTVTFRDGAVLTIPDGELARAIAGSRSLGWPAWVERRILVLLPALLGGAAAVVFLVVEFVVPAIAGYVAPRLSPAVSISVGDRYFDVVARVLELEPDNPLQEEDLRGFRELGASLATLADGDYEYGFDIDFDSYFGPNAFAFPNGRIVMTYALLSRLEEEEVAAVIAHELVHVTERHGLKSLIRASAWFVVSSMMLDPTILVYLPTVAELSYSREEESEADCLAAGLLHRAGYDPMAMARALETLHGIESEDEEGTDSGPRPLPPVVREEEKADAQAEEPAAEGEEELGFAGWLIDQVSEGVRTHPSADPRIAHARQCAELAAAGG